MTENLNIQGLQQKALDLWIADQASALELGRALIAVREAMEEHGAFTRWYTENELEENRVYYCIRKAEGKVKAPADKKPATEIVLNSHNLAIAKLAPKDDNKFVCPAVHIGPKGTTVTNGFLLIRVSLPPESPIVESESLVAPDFLTRLARENGNKLSRLEIEHDSVTATTLDETTLMAKIPKGTWPSTETLLAKVSAQEVTFRCHCDIKTLQALVASACEFNGADVPIEFEFRESVLFLKPQPQHDNQSWFGMMQITKARE